MNEYLAPPPRPPVLNAQSVGQSVAHPVCAGQDAPDAGLTTDAAVERLSEFGPNEPSAAVRNGPAAQLLSLLANPLVLILLLASAVSAALGETTSAALIVLIAGLGVALSFMQTFRSQRAVDRLREQVAPTAMVLRDGNWQRIRRRDVVPGDIIRLAAGDLVPADARLLTAKDLHVQQAALTGESMPVEKTAANGPSAVAEELQTVYFGTSVVSGTATAEVVATGGQTALGDIVARLAARPPESEFEQGTRKFSYFILQVVLFLVLFVYVVSLAARRDPLESLLFAVALAVGLTPEFLPMIVAVTLSQGAVHMARRQVIVKHLSAIQNFGSMDVLCSDKTGTLTSGTMELQQRLDPCGQPSTRPFVLAYINSDCETGIDSPLDAAILRAGRPAIDEYQKIDEIPFDFERRRLSIVADYAGERVLISKGAPEGILEVCREYEVDGRRRSFDAAARERCAAVCRELGEQGQRVLAVAYRGVPEQPAYRAADERDLVLAGFLAFCDPPLEDTAAALADLRREGVQVKILTGDNEHVARHVCGLVGLDGTRPLLGQELDSMTDTALAQVAERTTVFARVSPAQKNRILLALKRRGHVVGFLGDGINDAPSLHAADVGISVASAVDVAKDAAEIILQERGLRVLDSGIREGRKAFGNVMKYLLMGTSSNFGNMFSMAAASLFLPYLPMLPTQILLNNSLYDLAQITIPTDNVDAGFVRQPRRWDIGLIRSFMFWIGPVSSLFDVLTFWVLLKVFGASQAEFQTGWFVESLATQTLVLFVIRTAGNPLRSRPSPWLATTAVLVVLAGVALPWTPLAPSLGFVPLHAGYLAYLVVITATYLTLVQIVKSRLLRRWRSAAADYGG